MRRLTIISIMTFGFMVLVYFGVASVTFVVAEAQSAEEGEVVNAICPVMGGEVDKDTPYRVEYEGKIIGFCCPGCIKTFNANPQEYMQELKEVTFSGTLQDGVRVVKVHAFRYAFDPDPIVVKKGEKVILEVTSSDVEHGIGIRKMGVNLVLPPNETKTAEFTADKAGSFHIHCTVYCGRGHGEMHGTLKVIDE